MWRSDAEAENPAGPLYTVGRWAELDLVADKPPNTRCSSCIGAVLLILCPQTW